MTTVEMQRNPHYLRLACVRLCALPSRLNTPVGGHTSGAAEEAKAGVSRPIRIDWLAGAALALSLAPMFHIIFHFETIV